MSLTVKELVVYTPAKDFEVSKRFYAALGFALTEAWGGTMDCRLGGAAFRLQDYYVKDWANNFMMKLDVDDVEPWYERCQKVIATGEFGDARVSPPESVDDAKVLHVIDPSGILLVFVS